MLSRLRLADALGDQSAGRRRDAVVRRLLGSGSSGEQCQADGHRRCHKHEEHADKLVPFIDMAETGNNTEQNSKCVARFSFRRLLFRARPMAVIAFDRILRQ